MAVSGQRVATTLSVAACGSASKLSVAHYSAPLRALVLASLGRSAPSGEPLRECGQTALSQVPPVGRHVAKVAVTAGLARLGFAACIGGRNACGGLTFIDS